MKLTLVPQHEWQLRQQHWPFSERWKIEEVPNFGVNEVKGKTKTGIQSVSRESFWDDPLPRASLWRRKLRFPPTKVVWRLEFLQEKRGVVHAFISYDTLKMPQKWRLVTNVTHQNEILLPWREWHPHLQGERMSKNQWNFSFFVQNMTPLASRGYLSVDMNCSAPSAQFACRSKQGGTDTATGWGAGEHSHRIAAQKRWMRATFRLYNCTDFVYWDRLFLIRKTSCDFLFQRITFTPTSAKKISVLLAGCSK